MTLPPIILRISVSLWPRCTSPTVNSGQLVQAMLPVMTGVVGKGSSGQSERNSLRRRPRTPRTRAPSLTSAGNVLPSSPAARVLLVFLAA